jgi:hypothetical protein
MALPATRVPWPYWSATLSRMPDRGDLARQVVVNVAAGLAAGYAGPVGGAAAAGAVPVVLAGMDYISATIGSRRVEHATETLEDAADAFGAETPDEFIKFVQEAVSDPERQELLARALTIAQDTAMRDKRRALGRVVAQAASDSGTKVDNEMIYLRVLADLDEPHVRLLRLMTTKPAHQDKVNEQREALGIPAVRQWHPSDIVQADPGLKDVVWSLLPVLHRHGLISGGYEMITWAGREPEYTITDYGEWFLALLAEPE